MNAPKLFVGQIPPNIEENDLRQFLERFGPIAELVLIKDPMSKTHRGCAFLSYVNKASALTAMNELNDRVVLSNSPNPMQVISIDDISENENKLFIGMLPKVFDENDLNIMFGKYGDIKEIHIIRGPDNASKGCAFIKFHNPDSAFIAIESLNGTILEGSARPLVVKFAEMKKQVKTIKPIMNQIPHSQLGVNHDLLSSHLAVMPNNLSDISWNHSSFQQPTHQSSNALNSSMPFPVSVSNSISQQAENPGLLVQPNISHYNVKFNPSGVHSSLNQSAHSSHSTVMPQISSQPSLLSLQSQSSAIPQSYHQFPQNANSVYEFENKRSLPISTSVVRPTSHLVDEYRNDSIMNNFLNIEPMNDRHDSSIITGIARVKTPSQSANQDSNHRPPEGPSGANLFIYHLPRDLTDADLATLFAAFGNVVSAKVFIDKKTTESKGFGFVSYDSPSCAEAAIAAMNGFQIGSKRLKVQHKRSGNHFFPFEHEYERPVSTSIMPSFYANSNIMTQQNMRTALNQDPLAQSFDATLRSLNRFQL